MTFYERIENQGTQTLALWMFIKFWRECVMYFDYEARCVTDYQLPI